MEPRVHDYPQYVSMGAGQDEPNGYTQRRTEIGPNIMGGVGCTNLRKRLA